MDNLLARLSEFFVITFGITRPKPGQEKTAGLFIVALIAVILALFLTGIFVLIRVL